MNMDAKTKAGILRSLEIALDSVQDDLLGDAEEPLMEALKIIEQESPANLGEDETDFDYRDQNETFVVKYPDGSLLRYGGKAYPEADVRMFASRKDAQEWSDKSDLRCVVLTAAKAGAEVAETPNREHVQRRSEGDAMLNRLFHRFAVSAIRWLIRNDEIDVQVSWSPDLLLELAASRGICPFRTGVEAVVENHCDVLLHINMK